MKWFHVQGLGLPRRHVLAGISYPVAMKSYSVIDTGFQYGRRKSILLCLQLWFERKSTNQNVNIVNYLLHRSNCILFWKVGLVFTRKSAEWVLRKAYSPIITHAGIYHWQTGTTGGAELPVFRLQIRDNRHAAHVLRRGGGMLPPELFCQGVLNGTISCSQNNTTWYYLPPL